MKKVVEEIAKKLLHAGTRPYSVERVPGGKRVCVSLKGVGDWNFSLNDLVEERVIEGRVRGGFTDWPEMLRVGQRRPCPQNDAAPHAMNVNWSIGINLP